MKYLLMIYESEERALEIAARVPSARIGKVEIRPLLSEAGDA